MNVFSERLRQARMSRKLSLKQLAIKSKIPAPEISKYEHEKANPRMNNLYRLAKALCVSADWLIGLEDSNDKG